MGPMSLTLTAYGGKKRVEVGVLRESQARFDDTRLSLVRPSP